MFFYYISEKKKEKKERKEQDLSHILNIPFVNIRLRLVKQREFLFRSQVIFSFFNAKKEVEEKKKKRQLTLFYH